MSRDSTLPSTPPLASTRIRGAGRVATVLAPDRRGVDPGVQPPVETAGFVDEQLPERGFR
jgi:hypothetical protein